MNNIPCRLKHSMTMEHSMTVRDIRLRLVWVLLEKAACVCERSSHDA